MTPGDVYPRLLWQWARLAAEVAVGVLIVLALAGLFLTAIR